MQIQTDYIHRVGISYSLFIMESILEFLRNSSEGTWNHFEEEVHVHIRNHQPDSAFSHAGITITLATKTTAL